VTKGYYGGVTFGWPTPIGGVGGGLYFDNHENFYPQFYYGTPGWGRLRRLFARPRWIVDRYLCFGKLWTQVDQTQYRR